MRLKLSESNSSLRSEIFLLSFAVLGKVKDFLGVMAEANKRLELDAKVCFNFFSRILVMPICSFNL